MRETTFEGRFCSSPSEIVYPEGSHQHCVSGWRVLKGPIRKAGIFSDRSYHLTVCCEAESVPSLMSAPCNIAFWSSVHVTYC